MKISFDMALGNNMVRTRARYSGRSRTLLKLEAVVCISTIFRLGHVLQLINKSEPSIVVIRKYIFVLRV